MTECLVNDQTCGAEEDDYLQAFQQNLPKGPIWSIEDDSRIFSRFWSAISGAFAECSKFLCLILLELFPCTATAVLERWAAIFGYPTDCPVPDLTAERLCEWIQLQDSDCAGPTLGFLQEVAEWMGYPETTLTEWGVPQSSLGCGQIGCMQLGGSPDARGFSGCRQFLVVHLDAHVDGRSAEMGCGEMGINDLSLGDCAPVLATRFAQLGSCNFQIGCTPICGSDPPPIMCLIAKFVPVHVCVIYTEF
ncbi:hypothetical protein [Paraburkholderia youngii]|uniref:hypothetical protein n=1 Tax=Paraburkholderia youngii TaxID=2782701 RepID=UPI0015926CC6|nr:hypothetical protein [Paraburkholderia youngii]NUX55915.1 hypothetical protein [Paraburkholderia youngii]